MRNHNSNRMAIGAVLLLALASLLTIQWSEAQKSAGQQHLASGSNSVYGGYQRPALPTPTGKHHRFSASSSSFSSSSSSSGYGRSPAPKQPFYQPDQQQQQQQISGSSSYESSSSQQQADAEPASYGAVNGQPGKDFPAYTRVPKTSFTCDGLPYEYGMYADEETGCQAYHVCYNGRKDSFLCGVGTVFNQRILHCDYWYSVDCAKSNQYYSSNAFMGSSQPEPGPAQASPPGSYKRTQSSSSSYSATVNRPAGYQRTQQQQQSANSDFQEQQQNTY